MTWVPQACTLPVAEQPLRVAEFDDLLARAVRPAVRTGPTGLRVFLPGGDEVAELVRDLIARETACCSFFAFDLRVAETKVDTGADAELEVGIGVPDAQVAVLDALQARAEASRQR